MSFSIFCGNWPFFQMPSILSKKGDKIEGSNLPAIKRVFLKCVVHMHSSLETFLTHYLQHAYVLPFPSPFHDPHKAILAVCDKCPVVSSQPYHPNRLQSYPQTTKPEGQNGEGMCLGQHILKNST